MIILNEKEFAESCINNGQIVGKPFFTLSILAKYYYHHLGYRKKKITSLLIDFMAQNYPHYENNKLDWNSNIERIANNAGKYTLYEIDGVWITQSEIDTITNIHNKVLERLIFTFLCLAKLGNIKNDQNNGWVNVGDKEIFTLARITCNLQDRDIKIGKLRKLGLLELPKRNDNLSCRVTFVDDESEKVFQVCDFRELGYEYLKYKGENYIRCSECGILTKGNKNGTKKYCSSCAQYSPQEAKTIECIDCGEVFNVNGNSKRVCRCSACQMLYNKENMKKWRKQQYLCEVAIKETSKIIDAGEIEFDAQKYISGQKIDIEVLRQKLTNGYGTLIESFKNNLFSTIEALFNTIFDIEDSAKKDMTYFIPLLKEISSIIYKGM